MRSLFKPAAAKLGLAAILLGGSTGVLAADTSPLQVSAAVTGICKLVSVPAMSFSLDPSVATAGSGSSIVTYRCTKGSAAPTITLASAGSPYTNTLTHATDATQTIPFSISWTNPTTGGNGFNQTAQSVTLTGTIANADFVDKLAGTYNTPNVTVAINP